MEHRDSYVRLGQAGPQVFGPSSAPGSLLFIDVEPGQPITHIRDVKHEIFFNVRDILVRLDNGALDSSKGLFPEGVNVAKLVERVGEQPRLEWKTHDALKHEQGDLLRRARAIELTAMLHWGRAIWAPADHHYLLPSGRHAATFIKLMNAIRGTRDAVVISRWLLRHFSNEDKGLVIDTGTLSAVALSLEAELTRAGRRLGRVVVLEHYPRTAIDVQRAVLRAAEGGSGAVAVLSVNSSGQLRDRLHAALTLPTMNGQGAMEILVDQSGSVITPSDSSFEHIDTWTPLESSRPLADARTFERNCALCRDAQRAPIVTINPITFEQEYLPQIKAVAPCLKDPERNRSFWDICSTANALGLDETPDSHVAKYRPRGKRMGVHVRWQHLLNSDSFMANIAKELGSAPLSDYVAPRRPEARLVLIPQSDAERSGFERLWGNISGLFGVEYYQPFPNDGEWGSDLRRRVQEAQDIIVFALGVVTGGTLHRARNVLQTSRHSSDYERIRSLVVHARASGAREWETLVNSFAWQIKAIWRCYLPARSVLDDEAALLDTVDTDQLDDDELRFWEARKELCSKGHVDVKDAIFWGSSPRDRLSPHSIYGDRLNAVTTFVAVGAAMEAKRHERYSVPQRMVFDLSGITRSYYDPLILSSMLRWLLPFEQWWGALLPLDARRHVDLSSRVEGSASVVNELLWRANPEQRRILIPEILLAYAQGKVPRMEAEAAMSYANAFMTQLPDDIRGSVKLALRLAGLK